MAFNKQNSVEFFIIHQLSGVNLNAVQGKEDTVEYDTAKWCKAIDRNVRQGPRRWGEVEGGWKLCVANKDFRVNVTHKQIYSNSHTLTLNCSPIIYLCYCVNNQ